MDEKGGKKKVLSLARQPNLALLSRGQMQPTLYTSKHLSVPST